MADIGSLLVHWGLDKAVNIALAQLVKDGTLKLSSEKDIDKAANEFADALMAELAKSANADGTS